MHGKLAQRIHPNWFTRIGIAQESAFFATGKLITFSLLLFMLLLSFCIEGPDKLLFKKLVNWTETNLSILWALPLSRSTSIRLFFRIPANANDSVCRYVGQLCFEVGMISEDECVNLTNTQTICPAIVCLWCENCQTEEFNSIFREVEEHQ